jgi:hypothetical protein
MNNLIFPFHKYICIAESTAKRWNEKTAYSKPVASSLATAQLMVIDEPMTQTDVPFISSDTPVVKDAQPYSRACHFKSVSIFFKLGTISLSSTYLPPDNNTCPKSSHIFLYV